MLYNSSVKERAITGEIGKRMRDDPRFGSCAVEVKVCKGKTLGRGALKEHQRRALEIAARGALYFKISDESYGQKPFDLFVLKKSEAYVVVCFEGSLKKCFAVEIEKFPSNESLTLDEAERVGQKL